MSDKGLCRTAPATPGLLNIRKCLFDNGLLAGKKMLSPALSVDPLLIKTNDGDQEYYCKMCLKSFSKLNGLNRHLKKHSTNRSQKCPHCKKLFIDLKLHMLRHSDEKTYKCKLCEKSFARLSSLNRHTLNHKKTEKKSFYTETYFKIHFTAHISNRSKKCPLCYKMYIHLKIHTLRHSGENQ